jgi:hypothetical protein
MLSCKLLRLPRGLFRSGFPIKIMYAFIISLMRATISWNVGNYSRYKLKYFKMDNRQPQIL